MGEIHLPHCHCDNENKIIKCMPSVEDCSSMADIFKQLSDGTRLRILWMLCHLEEVVAHQRAHPLHDAVGRQVKEGLEFVVDAQHRDIALGVDRQQAVQEGDQQAGQGQIQDGRYTDGIELAVKGGIEPQAAAGEADGDFGGAVDIEVDHKGNGLPDAGGKGRTGNAQGGHRPKVTEWRTGE